MKSILRWTKRSSKPLSHDALTYLAGHLSVLSPESKLGELKLVMPGSLPNDEGGRVDVERAASERLVGTQRPSPAPPCLWVSSSAPTCSLVCLHGPWRSHALLSRVTCDASLCCQGCGSLARPPPPRSLSPPPVHPGRFIRLWLNFLSVFRFFISLIIVNLSDVLWLNFHFYSTFFLLFLNGIIALFLHLLSSICIFCDFLIICPNRCPIPINNDSS